MVTGCDFAGRGIGKTSKRPGLRTPLFLDTMPLASRGCGRTAFG